MKFAVRTHSLDVSLPADTAGVDLHDNLRTPSLSVPLSADRIDCPTHRADMAAAPCAVANVPLDAVSCSSAQVPLLPDEERDVATSDVPVPFTAPQAPTRKIPLERPADPACREIRMYTSDMATFPTQHLDDMPHTREMINIKYLDYPRISDYITRLAEEHGESYSGIKLIGIYEPVPLHRAYDLKLDTFSGRLSFRVRPEDPKQQKRFARVAYARVRFSGDIIQSVYPVT